MINLVFAAALSIFLAALTWRVIDIALSNLKRRTDELKKQVELLDRYYDLTARFLKETDAVEHRALRNIVCSMPAAIKRGDLAEIFVSQKINGNAPRKDPKFQAELDTEFGALSEEALHHFGGALGTAILASTYGLGSRGRMVRNWIYTLMGGPKVEVPYPKEMAFQIQPLMQPRSPDLAHA